MCSSDLGSTQASFASTSSPSSSATASRSPGRTQDARSQKTPSRIRLKHQAGAYWQISYTRRMKSRTEYVRKEYVKEVRHQTVTHKRFKRLVDQWIDLSIEHSRLTMQIAEPGATR